MKSSPCRYNKFGITKVRGPCAVALIKGSVGSSLGDIILEFL